MAQHRPRKPAPVEYSTDEEDMIIYEVEENEFESNPDYQFQQHPTLLKSCANHGGILPANKPKKKQMRVWGIFRRYPTTENLISFKCAKALARRIRRQCQRESWITHTSMCVFNHIVNYQLTVMEKGQRSEWSLSNFTFRILETF
ncbi:hypothetical protein TNCV_382681 [Trichonephila clavipes]|nr:hypothetical protein TNCV_382681 [Trichonephila clavipes]